jgi:hypothetical protein
MINILLQGCMPLIHTRLVYYKMKLNTFVKLSLKIDMVIFGYCLVFDCLIDILEGKNFYDIWQYMEKFEILIRN